MPRFGKRTARWVIGGIAAAAALGLFVAACGNDNPTPTATQAAPTATRAATPTAARTPAAAPTQAGGSTVTSSIVNFTLQNLQVPAGTTIVWTNEDAAPHTATSGSGTPDGTFDTGALAQGQSSRGILFDRPGTFHYYCTIHGTSMSGTVTVTAAGTPSASSPGGQGPVY
jgi:plastocyanin